MLADSIYGICCERCENLNIRDLRNYSCSKPLARKPYNMCQPASPSLHFQFWFLPGDCWRCLVYLQVSLTGIHDYILYKIIIIKYHHFRRHNHINGFYHQTKGTVALRCCGRQALDPPMPSSPLSRSSQHKKLSFLQPDNSPYKASFYKILTIRQEQTLVQQTRMASWPYIVLRAGATLSAFRHWSAS